MTTPTEARPRRLAGPGSSFRPTNDAQALTRVLARVGYTGDAMFVHVLANAAAANA